MKCVSLFFEKRTKVKSIDSFCSKLLQLCFQNQNLSKCARGSKDHPSGFELLTLPLPAFSFLCKGLNAFLNLSMKTAK